MLFVKNKQVFAIMTIFLLLGCKESQVREDIIVIETKDSHERLSTDSIQVILDLVKKSIASHQDSADSLALNVSDSMLFVNSNSGFFDKVSQVVKFRNNRNEREQKRINTFLLELIEEDSLIIDQKTLNKIDSILGKMHSKHRSEN